MAGELTVTAGRALRVTLAPGTARDDSPTVVAIASDGSSILDQSGGRVSLTVEAPPHGRLMTSAGTDGAEDAGGHAASHAVLLTPLPDARRAAAGVHRVEVVVDGWRFELDVESEARARLRERATSARAEGAKGGPSELRAIIPGRVVSVDVAEGDPVEAGGRLLVLEAMKMQNELRAPRAGTVARLAVGPGQTVELGDVLLVIE
jgi:biotin carboxyl carrier protein